LNDRESGESILVSGHAWLMYEISTLICRTWWIWFGLSTYIVNGMVGCGFSRWGPNVQQLTCIMHHIESQGGSLEHIPLVYTVIYW